MYIGRYTTPREAKGGIYGGIPHPGRLKEAYTRVYHRVYLRVVYNQGVP